MGAKRRKERESKGVNSVNITMLLLSHFLSEYSSHWQVGDAF